MSPDISEYIVMDLNDQVVSGFIAAINIEMSLVVNSLPGANAQVARIFMEMVIVRSKMQHIPTEPLSPLPMFSIIIVLIKILTKATVTNT